MGLYYGLDRRRPTVPCMFGDVWITNKNISIVTFTYTFNNEKHNIISQKCFIYPHLLGAMWDTLCQRVTGSYNLFLCTEIIVSA